MDNYFHTYHLSKLNQDHKINLKTTISLSEIETINLNLPNKPNNQTNKSNHTHNKQNNKNSAGQVRCF